jgi:hypothetical protein
MSATPDPRWLILAECHDALSELQSCLMTDVGDWLVEQTGNDAWHGLLDRIAAALVEDG